MAKNSEVIKDTWPIWKTGGRGKARHLSSSAELKGDPRQTDQCRRVGIAKDVSKTDYQHCVNNAVSCRLL